MQIRVRYRNESNGPFIENMIIYISEIIEDPVNIAITISDIPPIDMNIPVDNKIVFFESDSLIGLTYNEPKAQDIELSIKNMMPTQLDSPSLIVGDINMINPIKPASIPTIVNLVGNDLKINNAITATQIGIVELTSAVAPDDIY
ncbi:protein of unknown function [Candidatus Nitrosocosmicus franklandus]|uniref:Uncharacterized protein n=1 Tax=Candidatus Nitrosocosmicus franklandianus TaxID=1798806 RepID=A0A484IFW5_9ARCH|nr:protein of unknown function [Candidatus Nitrosocosmicus franklandus]